MTTMKRRTFLKALGISGLAATQLEQIQQAFASAQPGSFLPTKLEARTPMTHIINRLTFGPTDTLITHIQTIGVEAYIEEQLNPETIDDGAYAGIVGDLFDDLSLSPSEFLRTAEELGRDEAQYIARMFSFLVAQVIFKAIYSERQLYERMVHFWTDHFNVHRSSLLLGILKIVDDRDVVRQFALGKFRDILGASAHSPAMLAYLDNATSNKEAPNENYARELLELHTLGVNGGYTEDDVKEVARCFTGWSFNPPRRPNIVPGEFNFNARAHDDGEKTVLGHVIPAGGGLEDGERVLDILASHPSTARFVSSKIIRRFVADDPPETLVDRCTEVFLQTDGDTKAILRTIFASEEFWNAPPKFKRPLEYTISLMRPLYPSINFQRMFRQLRETYINLGHLPFNRPSPDGYPDVESYWATSLLGRWNAGIATARNEIQGIQLDTLGLLNNNNVTLEAESIIAWFSEYLYGRPLTSDESTVIQNYLTNTGENRDTIAEALALLLIAPAYQYR